MICKVNYQSVTHSRQRSFGGIKVCVRSEIVAWLNPFSFEDTPKDFGNIKVRRIWRQKDNMQSSLFSQFVQCKQSFSPVFRSIVKDDNDFPCNSERNYIYNKKGQMLYEIDSVRKTSHKAYIKLFDAEDAGFRLAIRKMVISKSLYQDFYVLDNGWAFLQNTDNKVGLVLFSKLKVPFEYEAIAVPQNGYTLAIKESYEPSDDEFIYDCLLMKVRSQIKEEDFIHPTGITQFAGKKHGMTFLSTLMMTSLLKKNAIQSSVTTRKETYKRVS